MKQSRNTIAKSEIFQIITDSENAVSHADIQIQVKELCDRVTIYRVLDRLVEEGKIHKIMGIDGVIRYAACIRCTHKHKHNHIHFSCESCKAVSCLDEVVPVFSLPRKYKVNEVHFTVSGICPQCEK